MNTSSAKQQLRFRVILGVMSLVVFSAAQLRASAPSLDLPITILHSFGFSGGDGYSPVGNLYLSGGTLYGTTSAGGGSGGGTVFKINTDGTGYLHLRSLSNGNGGGPTSGLVQFGSKLYGANSDSFTAPGYLYSLNPTGPGFTIEHTFADTDSLGNIDGTDATSGLVQVGSKLYGTTHVGGDNDAGTIYSFDPVTRAETVLHNFGGTPNDGREPYYGGLSASGNTLFGTTLSGGQAAGVLFSMNADGTGYQILHSFGAVFGEGYSPYVPPIVDGTKLYGTTSNSTGSTGGSTIYSINTDGTGFIQLHVFDPNTEGTLIVSSVSLVDGKLYGTSASGGIGHYGTLFSINTDGTDFTILHNFSSDLTNGGAPYGGVVSDGSFLYGTAIFGGTSNGGIIYAVPVPEPAAWQLAVTALLIGILVVKKTPSRRAVRCRSTPQRSAPHPFCQLQKGVVR